MIPMLMRIRVVLEAGWGVRLWLPLFIVWIIALPFALIALPCVMVGCWFKRLSAWKVVSGFWNVISGLSGTHVEFSDGRDSVLVRIY